MISLCFGSPGAGKSTYIAHLAYKYYGKRPVFCNFDCAYTYKFNLSQLGLVAFPARSLILIDEAGIDFNNRNYKAFPKEIIKFLKLHRHYDVDIMFFSQSWEDVDITIRRLAVDLSYLRKLGPWTMIRRVNTYVMVDKDTHQIVDGYKFMPLWMVLFGGKPLRFIFRPFYYHMFDSYEAPPLLSFPQQKWSFDVCPSSILFAWFRRFPRYFFRLLRRFGRGKK